MRRALTRSDAYDASLALLMSVLGGVSLYIGGDPAYAGPDFADYSRPLAIVLLVVIHLALAVRRRFPLTTALVVTAAFLPVRAFDIPEFQIVSVSLFIAIYTAGAYGGPRRDRARWAVVVGILALVAWTIVRELGEPYDGRVPMSVIAGFTTATNVFYLVAGWALGDVVRTRRERELELLAKASELEQVQADRARRAVLDERIRISRELHDVVAHHVSVMGVQAGAARRVLPSRPEAVPELLASVEEASRQAIAELQRLLGLLRTDDDGHGAGPQPTLGELPALVEQMGDAGLQLQVDVAPDLEPVPAAVHLSAYRIVQEALTNTLKHAGPGTAATVTVARSARALEVVVRDDGGGNRSPGVGAPGGHGIAGMRERVALHHGELRCGPTGRGFEVRAWFPVGERTPAVAR